MLRICIGLESIGGDADRLLKEFDLSLDQLFQPGYRVPTNLINQMMIQCLHETQRDDFGVLVGQTTPITNSALGIAVRASKDGLEAINRFKRFAPVIESGTVLTTQRNETAHIVSIGGWEERWHPSIQDAFISSFCLAITYLLSKKNKPLYLKLQQSKPNNPAAWQDAFTESIEWDAPISSIAWSSEALLHPRLLADKKTASLNDDLMEPQLHLVLRENLSRRVKEQIAAHLHQGVPTPQTIAHDLNLGTRTLQRLLKEDGTSFKDILKLLRQQYAKEKMLNSSASITEIASQLGYEDPNTFSKAFKSWFGLSPSEYFEQESSKR